MSFAKRRPQQRWLSAPAMDCIYVTLGLGIAVGMLILVAWLALDVGGGQTAARAEAVPMTVTAVANRTTNLPTQPASIANIPDAPTAPRVEVKNEDAPPADEAEPRTADPPLLPMTTKTTERPLQAQTEKELRRQ